MYKKLMLLNLIKGNFILCFKDFIIFEVKIFDVFCWVVLKRFEKVLGFMIVGNCDDLLWIFCRIVGCCYSWWWSWVWIFICLIWREGLRDGCVY